jgi:4-amino-4-deoxy-L-arabinose transferase-like glycosyltransferase
MKKSKLIILALLLVVGIAAFTRFYRLGQDPPSITWDEAAVGYNAWTIWHWGKDEWGTRLPIVFKSFEDYKNPVHVYLTVPFVAIFGLTEVAVRASSALFGVLNVLIIFFLARRLFKSDSVGLLSSFFLALSPFSLQFSRFNHELNFAIFFFMLGIYLILKGIDKRNYLLVFGFASLGLDLLTYHSAKIMVPPILLLLIILNIRKLWKMKKYFVAGILVFGLFASLLFIEPQLLGLARIQQNKTEGGLTLQILIDRYLSHFNTDFLFNKGDPNPRHSTGYVGVFYKVDALFLLIGILALILGFFKDRKKEFLVLIAWALLAPVPAIFSPEIPHAARAMFITGSWHMIAGFGAFTLIELPRIKQLKVLVAVLLLSSVIWFFRDYVKSYYENYSKRYAIEWQYGMKEVVGFAKANPWYYRIYMTDVRQQPYIFYLFYLKFPLPELLATVKYDTSIARSYNTVASFDRYKFGSWDFVESTPNSEVLYVLQPSNYDGLRYKKDFDVKLLVKYPNDRDAFYLVSGKSE